MRSPQALPVLLRLPRCRARVADAVRRKELSGLFSGIHHCESAAALKVYLATHPPGPAVVDPFQGEVTAADYISEIVSTFTVRPLLYIEDFLPAREIVSLARIGLRGFVTLDQTDSPDEIARLVLRAHLGGSVKSAISDFVDTLPIEVRPIMWWLVAATVRPLSVAQAARGLHMSKRTLERRCRAAGLVTPLRLIQCLRALHAAALLSRHQLDLPDVARRLGWVTIRQMRQTTQDVLGIPPSVVAKLGFSSASQQVVAEMRSVRGETIRQGDFANE